MLVRRLAVSMYLALPPRVRVQQDGPYLYYCFDDDYSCHYCEEESYRDLWYDLVDWDHIRHNPESDSCRWYHPRHFVVAVAVVVAVVVVVVATYVTVVVVIIIQSRMLWWWWW